VKIIKTIRSGHTSGEVKIMRTV